VPRPSKPARLRLEGAAQGRPAVWYIIDGRKRISTGCGQGDTRGAERQLAAYIAQQHAAPRSERAAVQIPVADVLSIYATEVVAAIPEPSQKRRAIARTERLLEFFGGMKLSEINGETCRAYVRHRGNAGGSRRDLEDLSAAIGHHLNEGFHREIIKVVLPPKGGRRERWLTRSELARLVLTAWRMREEQRRIHDGSSGERLPTSRRTGQHLARALLFGYYTASRPGDVFTASFHAGPGRSWIDLEQGVFHRLPEGKTATKKRQEPVKIGNRLLSHLKRWKIRQMVFQYVVEWEGHPVKGVKTALNRAVALAGLGDGVTMYSLRHSRITHQMMAGVKPWEVAKAASTSLEMIEQHYGHFQPDFMRDAVNAR
jgi:hypothetical protein